MESSNGVTAAESKEESHENHDVNESGWTMYMLSSIHEHDVDHSDHTEVVDDDDDDHADDNSEDDEDSTASDASSGRSPSKSIEKKHGKRIVKKKYKRKVEIHEDDDEDENEDEDEDYVNKNADSAYSYVGQCDENNVSKHEELDDKQM